MVINHMAQPGPLADTAADTAAADGAAVPPPPPPPPPPSTEWVATVQALAEIPTAFMKISAVFEAAPAARPAPAALDYYRPHLDVLWGVFGPGRLVYGSNWPVCDRAGDPQSVYGDQLNMLRAFFAEKGRDAAERFFWRNAVAAYGVQPHRGQR